MSYDISLSLTYFTQYDNLYSHPCCCKWHYFSILMDNIPLYICTMMWTIFKAIIEFFLQYCFCFMFWFLGHKAYGILGPWPGLDSTLTACNEKWGLSHWTTREVYLSLSLTHILVFILWSPLMLQPTLSGPQLFLFISSLQKDWTLG